MSDELPPLRSLWYMVGLSASLKAGGLRREMLAGEPVLIARTKDGEAFALRDICPHRAAPLSGGRIVGAQVECPYHGWRFRTDGVCAAIPSVVAEQNFAVDRIRVNAYPLREQDGLIWVYLSTDAKEEPVDPPPAMPIGAITGHAKPGFIESQIFPTSLDHAVVGLMDPAHGPFVHRAWWWRSEASIHPKAKHHAPSKRGFTMVSHKPSSNSALYRVLGGDLSTEIRFELPGLRFERIKVGKREVLGFTAVTPLTADTTRVTQVFYWNLPWLILLRPFFRPFARAFIGQDRKIVEMQNEGLKFAAPQMLIQDADVPALWYYRLKKAWAESVVTATPFVNPVQERTLHWRS